MSTVVLSSYLRPITDTGNTSVEISASDFVKQLMSLNIKPQFDYYSRDGRGHFRFITMDGQSKVAVAISKAGLPLVSGNTVTERFKWCLSNLVLRAGISSPEYGANKFLSFGVRGEGGNLEHGVLTISEFVTEYAGG